MWRGITRTVSAGAARHSGLRTSANVAELTGDSDSANAVPASFDVSPLRRFRLVFDRKSVPFR